MKAMILAAGLGTRMLPLTKNTPKPLVKVNNKYLIEYSIESAKQAGITQLVINLHHLGEQLKEALGNGNKFGVNISYSEEPDLLDTGGGIVNALDNGLLGSEPFIVISSDIITSFNFASLAKKLSKLAHLILVPNFGTHTHGDYSLTNNDLQLPTNNPKLNFTYASMGIFDPKFFLDHPSGPFPLTVCINKAIANQQITAEFYAGPWSNIGTAEDLQTNCMSIK